MNRDPPSAGLKLVNLYYPSGLLAVRKGILIEIAYYIQLHAYVIVPKRGRKIEPVP
jgi:hypothetical protein